MDVQEWRSGGNYEIEEESVPLEASKQEPSGAVPEEIVVQGNKYLKVELIHR